jgi:hypothetical protein
MQNGTAELRREQVDHLQSHRGGAFAAADFVYSLMSA